MSLADKDAQQVLLTKVDKRQEGAKPTRIFSKYLPGREMNVAVIVNVDGSDEPMQSVLLLYGRGTLAPGPMRGFPPWYVIGVSEITNGLLIREDGSAVLKP